MAKQDTSASSQPLVVLPADNPPRREISFVVHEYMGLPVHKMGPNAVEPDPEPLMRQEDIQVGDAVLVPSLGPGYMKVEVKQNDDGSLYGETDQLIVCLVFDQDDRHCWTTGGYISMRGLTKLGLTT